VSEKLEFIATLQDETKAALSKMVENHKAAVAQIKKHNTDVAVQHKAQAKSYAEITENIGKFKNVVSGAVTPAMASLGLATYGVGTGIAKVIDLLKQAGESYNILNDAARRSGTSAGYITAITVAMERLGISAAAVPGYIAEMGDHLARIQRGAPQELNALTGSFKNMLPIIRETLKGATTGEERITRLLKLASQHPEVPVDKWAKFYEAIGGPASLGTKNLEEVEKALSAGAEAAKHMPDPTLLKGLDEAFSHLRESLNAFGNDTVRIFGPAGIKLVEGFASAIDKLGENAVRNKIDKRSIFGRALDALGLENTTAPGVGGYLGAGRGAAPEGGASFKDRFDAMKKPVAEGVLQGLRDFAIGRESDASMFANGLKPMAYHPGGGGGGMFGSKEYPAVDGGTGGGDAGGVGGGQGGPLTSGGGGKSSFGPKSFSSFPPKAGGGGGPAAGGQGGMIPSAAGLRGSDYLRAERERYAKEFEVNPELKKRLAAIVQLENPGAGTAVVESLMNRGNIPSHTRSIEQGMGGGAKSFYNPVRKGLVPGALAALERNPKRMAERMAQIDAALAGSNQTQGYTDQGSKGDPNYETGGVGVNINKERFNDWGVPGSKAYRLHQQAMVAGEGLKQHGANIREFVARGRRSQTDGQLLKQGMKAVDAGGTSHTLDINLGNFPRGTQTKYAGDPGLFKSVKLNRGRPMANASEDS
jgi:hypothetical protein